MQRIGGYVLVAAVAAAAGAAAVRWISPPDAAVASAAPIDVAVIEDVTAAEADALRSDRYASLTTIEDVLALPGEFAEREALYVIAAQADSVAVQDLIYQALAVQDTRRRDTMVEILLLRLVELDPRTALAVAAGPLRRTGKRYTPSVYSAWSRNDFATALTAAALSDGPKASIAAALYRNLPFLDDPRAAEIESALGVAPSFEVVAESIERAYGASPERALEVIGALAATTSVDSTSAQKLAGLLIADLGAEAFALVESGSAGMGESLRSMLENALLQQLAIHDPRLAIDKMAVAPEKSRRYLFPLAFATLARESSGEAIALLERVPEGERRRVEQSLMEELAKDDVGLALVMAEGMTAMGRETAITAIISSATVKHLDAALEAVTMLDDPANATVALSTLSRRMPASAMPAIAARMRDATATDSPRRTDALSSFAANWARKDADAALVWVDGLAEQDRDRVMDDVVRVLAKRSPDQAVRLASAVRGRAGQQVRRELTTQLVRNDQVDAALALARGAEDGAERLRLETAALTRLAGKEPERAMMLARESGDADLQNMVTAAAIERDSTLTPRAALLRAREITDPVLRSETVTSVVRRAAQRDPQSAFALVDSLPAGRERDGALAGLAKAGGLEVDDAFAYMDQIEDDTIRQRAQLELLFPLALKSPERARALMDDMALPPAMRQQFDMFLRQQGVRD